MKYTVNITISPEEKPNEDEIKALAVQELAKANTYINQKEITSLVFCKKSIDARKGRVRFHLRYDIYTNGDKPETNDSINSFKPTWKKADPKKRVLIIGSGPAGLFAALRLLEYGITPVIIERGPETSQRKIDIADISRKGTVNPDSNYCFGEGGAGTFSDGKLYSRSNKRGNIGRILGIFNYHGADSVILTDAHPHIGTDKLPSIVNTIRKTIIDNGGEFIFNTRCTGFTSESDIGTYNKKRITGITTINVINNKEQKYTGSAVILAAGHSSPDIYTMLFKLDETAIEAKPFAIGVRVEHPREIIDKIQYHGKERGENLPAAEYRLTTQVDDRGVYSFCMCPGGLVVPSASSPDGIVINGMSPSSRNSRWSNAAIVVEIKPEDYFTTSKNPLDGLNYRTSIETSAKKAVSTVFEHNSQTLNYNPQTAPAQRLVDFMDGKLSKNLPETSYTPGIVSTRLDLVLPAPVVSRLQQAFSNYNKNMKGFICSEALIIAPETRTSTPVRILRDTVSLESPAIFGLYPAGEGSGYAGGIVSSAMDGEKVADAVVNKYFNS